MCRTHYELPTKWCRHRDNPMWFFANSSCRHKADPNKFIIFWAASCSSWIDTAGKPWTCGGFLGGQMHWAASFSHKGLCKSWSCSRHTHKRHPLWPQDVPFSYSFVHTWHTSACGVQGKSYVCVSLSYGQTHSVANLSVMDFQLFIRMLERLFIPDFTMCAPKRASVQIFDCSGISWGVFVLSSRVRWVGVFVYES